MPQVSPASVVRKIKILWACLPVTGEARWFHSTDAAFVGWSPEDDVTGGESCDALAYVWGSHSGLGACCLGRSRSLGGGLGRNNQV